MRDSRNGRSAPDRSTTRRTPRDSLLCLDPLLANPLAIWEEPTRAARHGGEIGVRPRGGRSQSFRGCISPSLPPFSRRRCHKVTRSLGSAGFTRASVRTCVCSIDRLVGRSVAIITDAEYAPRRSAIVTLAAHRIRTATIKIHPRSAFGFPID